MAEDRGSGYGKREDGGMDVKAELPLISVIKILPEGRQICIRPRGRVPASYAKAKAGRWDLLCGIMVTQEKQELYWVPDAQATKIDQVVRVTRCKAAVKTKPYCLLITNCSLLLEIFCLLECPC
jgi:hypothetical protein